MGRPRLGNLHTHRPRRPPDPHDPPGVLGVLGSRATPPRARETKAGGRPPESHRREARPGKPKESVSLEPNSSSTRVPWQAVSRASSTSLLPQIRPDNRANSVTGDRRAPSAGRGAGLPRLLISTLQKPAPSGGRSSRPNPARGDAPPARLPTCSRPSRGPPAPASAGPAAASPL